MSDGFDILLADDDLTSISILGRSLRPLGRLRFASSGSDALVLARQAAPDLVFLDLEMPGLSGFEVCAAMKASDRLRDVPIILVTSQDNTEQELRALTLGAADFLSKPLRPAQVIARARAQLAMKAMADTLRRAVASDALTGISNRRQFDDTLACEWPRAWRSRLPLSLVIADVDHFKAYDDHYGHRAGDTCLAAVAHAMQCAVHRRPDLVARYGGDEFVILLPDTDQAGARTVAQRVLASVEALALTHAASPVAKHVTLSAGVATCTPSPRVPAGSASTHGSTLLRSACELIEAADQALDAARRAGHRRVTCAALDVGSEPAATATSAHAVGPARAP